MSYQSEADTQFLNLIRIEDASRLPLPLYVRIAEGLTRALVFSGATLGREMPSVRLLSEHLDTTSATVQQAYHRLRNDGLITLRDGKGYFVSDMERARQRFAETVRSAVIDRLRDEIALGSSAEALKELIEGLETEMMPARARNGRKV